jgi:RNase P protein component
LKGTGLVGYATSRQIGCHARRNRQRRRAAEAMRGLDVHGLDLAVTVKPSARDATLGALREELQFLVTEIRARWESGSASD